MSHPGDGVHVLVTIVVAVASTLADAVVIVVALRQRFVSRAGTVYLECRYLTICPAGSDLVRLAGVVVGGHGGCRMSS